MPPSIQSERYLRPAAWLCVGWMSVAPVLFGAVVLSTDFGGRTVSGKTASNITWTTTGVQNPGDLTWVLEGGGPTNTNLFDTANAQGHFAPDLNVGNEGPWSVDVPLVVASGYTSISLASIDLDWQHFNNAGAFQSVSRLVDWTATVTGSLSGQIGTASAANVGGISGLETLTFTSPLLLPAGESYVLNIRAAGSNGDGNNTGLDGFTLNGSANAIPEPSAIVLSLLGLVGVLCRRRR